MEKPTSFHLRFYSTLPDTGENTLRVTLGEVPKSEIVPDRVYNTRSVLDAFYGYPAVGEIDYDISKNPLRMDVAFATMGPDLQPLPSRRQQLLFNNLQSDRVRPDDLFVCSEYVRTVTLGPGRRVTVTDSETLSQYELMEDGRIEGKQRVAFYLTPNPNTVEGTLFFEANNKAVALFDYSFTMKKVGDCVMTPKAVEQCTAPEGSYVKVNESGDDGA